MVFFCQKSQFPIKSNIKYEGKSLKGHIKLVEHKSGVFVTSNVFVFFEMCNLPRSMAGIGCGGEGGGQPFSSGCIEKDEC